MPTSFPFFGETERREGPFPADVFLTFTFESLHNLHPVISVLLENCFVSFVGSAALCTKVGSNVRGSKAYKRFKGIMLQVCSILLTLIKDSFLATVFYVYFFIGDLSSNFTGLIERDGVHDMLENKDYHC